MTRQPSRERDGRHSSFQFPPAAATSGTSCETRSGPESGGRPRDLRLGQARGHGCPTLPFPSPPPPPRMPKRQLAMPCRAPPIRAGGGGAGGRTDRHSGPARRSAGRSPAAPAAAASDSGGGGGGGGERGRGGDSLRVTVTQAVPPSLPVATSCASAGGERREEGRLAVRWTGLRGQGGAG